MGVDGWHPDPYGIHEERLFAHGEPTPVVRDQGIGSLDAPRQCKASPGTARSGTQPECVTSTKTGPSGVAAAALAAHALKGAAPGPTRPMLALAALFIAAGVIVGVLGLTGGGNPRAPKPRRR